MSFAMRLKELRLRTGLTQKKLAEASGLGIGTITDYEQARREPTLESAFKLADALGVDVQEFRESKTKKQRRTK
jgi:transcriptional regulator with XRE-family HTH domain